ncbi:MAG: sulfite exporter TauE/SafE family protein [Leptospiraceae bacterium]|nr:sulfite exporter TauE/SafE family protein [Leptospiraceae bacterium]
MSLFQIILPVIVGISLGLIGGGGTALAVPVLVYFFDQDPKSAIGMSLGIVCVVSLAGSISHWRQHNVRLESAAFFTPFTMLGAFIGAKVATLPFITSSVQLFLFSITILSASLVMIFKKSKEEILALNSSLDETDAFQDSHPRPNSNTHTHSHPNSNPNSNSDQQNISISIQMLLTFAILGLFVGILTGLVGVGGGFLIVPTLVYLGKVPIRQAIGTSLVVIFFNSFSGFLGYLGKVEMDWFVIILFTLLSLVGVVIGSHFSNRMPKKFLQKIFGIFLFGVGLWILWKELV